MLQNYNSVFCSSECLELVLGGVDQYIENSETLKRLPKFLGTILMKQTEQISFPIAMPHEINRQMVQELCSAIPKLNKDNLMPKDVSTENQSISIQPSIINLKQPSSLTKKNSTANSRTMKSVTFTERRSIRQAKKNQTPCEMLKVEQNEEDNQILRLRQKTQMRLRYDFQYQKLTLMREKSFRQKSKFLDDLIGQEPLAGITHDYEGEQLKSSIAEDKIKHYSMKAEFGTMTKRKKQEQFNRPIQMSIEINKFQKEKEHANKLVRPMEMPLFPVEHKDFSHLHEIRNYKLHDYRKHFGKKYSRLDQYSQTVDLTRLSHNKEHHNEEIFSEKKHLRDSSLLEGSRESVEVKGPIRRLALPRLHGKYKVLDRYDQV